MKKILIIQSRVTPSTALSERREYANAVKSGAELTFVSSLDTALPWNTPQELLGEHNAVIFAGSGDFDFDGGRAEDDEARIASHAIARRMGRLVHHVLEKNFPTLGVCYGHQIIAEVVGVPVVHDPLQRKRGSFDISLTEAGRRDVIFSDFPDIFAAQYGHKDSVSEIPKEAVLLGESTQCKASAFRYGKNIYTTQFHPELTHDDLARRLQNSPGYLPEGVSVESMVRPSFEASTIIPKFIERIVCEG